MGLIYFEITVYLCILRYSCENIVLVTISCYPFCRENCLLFLLELAKCHIFWETNGKCPENKQYLPRVGKPVSCLIQTKIQFQNIQFTRACISDVAMTVAILFLVSSGLNQLNCLQSTTIWSCESDFQFIPKPKIFWWRFPPSFQGMTTSGLPKMTNVFRAHFETL